MSSNENLPEPDPRQENPATGAQVPPTDQGLPADTAGTEPYDLEAAELAYQAFGWADGATDLDVVAASTALQAAEAFDQRINLDQAAVAERSELGRLQASARLTGAWLLAGLDRQDEAREVLSTLADDLAVDGGTPADDARSRIRARALLRASRLTDDPAAAISILDRLLDGDAVGLNDPMQAHRLRAHLLRLDRLTEAETPISELIRYAEQAVAERAPGTVGGIVGQTALVGRLVSLLERAGERGRADAAYLAHAVSIRELSDEPLRAAGLGQLVALTSAGEQFTLNERERLGNLRRLFADDAADQTQGARAMLDSRLGRAQVGTGQTDQGLITLRAWLDHWADLPGEEFRVAVPPVAIAIAFAYADQGRSISEHASYIWLIGRLTARQNNPAADDLLPAEREGLARARYWRSRRLREGGNVAESDREVDDLVTHHAGDEDPEVRLQAANALYSQWQDALSPDAAAGSESGEEGDAQGLGPDPQRALAVMHRFAEHFDTDTAPAIERLNVRRLLRQGGVVRDLGDEAQAVKLFSQIISRYGDRDLDGVAAARENLTILGLRSSAVPAGAMPAESALVGSAQQPGPVNPVQAAGSYDELAASLDEAEGFSRRGQPAEAYPRYRSIMERGYTSDDRRIQLLGASAGHDLIFDLAAAERWPTLIDEVEPYLASLDRLDGVRASRCRAWAWVRLAQAYAKMGDPQRGIATYRRLEQATNADDSDVAEAVSLGLYNAAVLLDEQENRDEALAAYDRLVQFHSGQRVDRAQSLRELKALRNRALLLTRLGRPRDAADTYRRAIELVGANADPDFAGRGRQSAYDLAHAQTIAGDHHGAVETYQRMLSPAPPAFPAAEQSQIKDLLKAAKKTARRDRRR